MLDVPLADIVRQAGRRAGSETGLPVYSVTKHAGFVPSLEFFNKRIFSRDVSSYKVVDVGNFAYATIHLDEGSIGIAPVRALISPMYTVFSVDESRVDQNYLLRYLKSPRALAQYSRLGRGAIHRRKAISLENLGALRVPLPPRSEQRRIAEILDHADALRAKRRQVLAHLDALTQSIFHHMFGDPDAAPDTVPLGQVAGLAGGRSLVSEDAAASSAYRVLKISAVTTGEFRPQESKPLPSGYVPPREHIVRQGDLLISRANTAELVGAAAYVSESTTNLALPDKIWRFEWHDASCEPLFFHALLRSPALRRKISKASSGTGGSMKNISKAHLQSMLIPRVKPALQAEFAARAAMVRRQRVAVHEAVITDTALFASLQSRAFRGEL